MMVNRVRKLSGINTLAYMGVEPEQVSGDIVTDRAPTTDDRARNLIGTRWVQRDTAIGANDARIWILTRLDGSGPSGTATWTELETGGTGMGVDFFTTDDGNTALPSAGEIDFGGGTSTGGVATNLNTFTNPNNSENMFVATNNSLFQPHTADINTGVYGLGGSADANRFLHNYGDGGGSDGNTWLGLGGGNFALTGTQNTGLGRSTLAAIESGSNNTMAGFQSGDAITSGGTNTGYGNFVLSSLVTGSSNTAFGASAGSAYTGAESSNILIKNTGVAAESNTIRFGTTGAGAGQQNRFFMGGITDVAGTIEPPTTDGLRYLMFVVPDTEQVGTHTPPSLGAGSPVPLARVYGSNNLFFGRASGNETLTVANAVRNVAMGTRSLRSLTDGQDNTGYGYQTLESCTVGMDNCAQGSESLNSLTEGDENVGIGNSALTLITTGSRNAALGIDSGASLTGSDSDNFIVLNNGTAGDNNTVRIGSGTGTGNKQFNQVFFSGIFGRGSGGGNAVNVLATDQLIDATTSSRKYKTNIRDMADDSSAVMKLRPVTFNWKNDEHKQLSYGLIAEEVHEVMPTLSSYDGNGKLVGVHYDRLPSILLNELQKMVKRVEKLEAAACTKCEHAVG